MIFPSITVVSLTANLRWYFLKAASQNIVLSASLTTYHTSVISVILVSYTISAFSITLLVILYTGLLVIRSTLTPTPDPKLKAESYTGLPGSPSIPNITDSLGER